MSEQPPTATTRRPNVLFILADDLGWNDVSFHNAPIRTPQLDWLARNGIELTHHYVCPLCTPTRVSLLTGRHPARFGPHATRPSNPPVLPDGYQTLASALRDAGYDTGLFGKWHLGSDPRFGPHNYGFDYAYGSLAGGVDPYNHCYKRGPHSQTWHRNGERVDERGHVTDLITDEAIRWIHERPLAAGEDHAGNDRPWFCYVPFTAVHTPIKPPQNWIGRYHGETYDAVAERDRSFKMYAAYASHMDHNVGRLVEAVAEREELENTIIVFSSDNGAFTEDPTGNDVSQYPGRQEALPRLGSNAPLRGRKGQMYEGGIRTPTLIHWAGTLAPGKVDTPMQIVDWMPTLLSLIDHTPSDDPQWDGRDIWPAITGQAPTDDQRVLYWNLSDNRFAVRRGRWKLIVHDAAARAEDCELFDLDADPYETTDLSPNEPDRVRDLLEVLRDQRQYDGISQRADAPTP
ncbi:MAG: sulfatase [Phycisphaeraceae bacterium]